MGAYASNENREMGGYVTSFPDGHGKWQVSTVGGEQPRWRGDGKELFYLSSDYKMMAVPPTTGANFNAGAPEALLQTTPGNRDRRPELVRKPEQMNVGAILTSGCMKRWALTASTN